MQDIRAYDQDSKEMLCTEDVPMPHWTGRMAFFFMTINKVEVRNRNLIYSYWSGVLDKEKHKLYDGDFIEATDEEGNKKVHLIEFDGGAFAVVGDFGDVELTSIGWAISYWENNQYLHWRKIGNKWENPEHLEKVENLKP